MSIQQQQRPLTDSSSSSSSCWDCTLPGPPSRNNGGSADLSPSGLLAYASGSSITVIDTRSMQLVLVIPLPPPSSHSSTSNLASNSSLSPFVTSVRWSPHPLRRDLLSHDPSTSPSHLLLASGDRQGRIAILDLRLKAPLLFLETDSIAKLGIQDLCWIHTRLDYWILAALAGPSLLSLYNVSTGRCFFKYDASPEFFSCIQRDPFDARHFCALGDANEIKDSIVYCFDVFLFVINGKRYCQSSVGYCHVNNALHDYLSYFI